MAEYDPYRLPDDFGNPYAAPEIEIGPRGERARMSPGVEPFSPGAALRRAWTIYNRRFGVVFAIVFGTAGLNYLIQVAASAMLDGPGGPASAVTALLVVIGMILLLIWLSTIQSFALVHVARDESVTMDGILSCARFVPRVIGSSFLYVLATAGAMAVCMIPIGLVIYFARDASPVVTITLLVLGGAAAIAVLLGISAKLCLYMCAIVDRDAGAVESLQFSYHITRGHEIEIIGLMIVAFLIAAAGVLLLCVGVLFTIPLAGFVLPCSYVLMADEWTRKPTTKAPLGFDFSEFPV
jgi:hypothetical protein